MAEVIWTNFAISELKGIYLYYRMVAGERVAEKIRNSIFSSTDRLLKYPSLGPEEENLKELKQGHRYIVSGNYKIG